MGIADLPDISDEDWLSYNADVFRRQTQPIVDSSLFMQQTAMPTRSAIEQLASLSTAPPPVAPPPPQVVQPPSQPMPDIFGGQMGGSTGLFQSDGIDPSGLMSSLSQYPDDQDDELGPVMGPPNAAPSPGTNPLQQAWGGIAPDKPNVFSWAGTQLGNLADQARGNPLLQSGQGQFATGAVRGLSGMAHELGGSAEALRQGDVLGGIGGTLKVATSPGDVFRGAAAEMNLPKQIFSGISPETPVIGGLNNPRELAGLIPEIMLPNTALENVIGRGIGAVAKPALRGVGRAATALGEVASPYVDQALSAGRRWATDAPSAVRLGEDTQAYHGSPTVFEEMQPGKGMFGDAVYLGDKPEVGDTFSTNGQPYGALALSRADEAHKLERLRAGGASAEEISAAEQVVRDMDRNLEEAVQYGYSPPEGQGSNVRPVTIPKGVNVWDANQPFTRQQAVELIDGFAQEWQQSFRSPLPQDIRSRIENKAADALSAKEWRGEQGTAFDVYHAIGETVGESSVLRSSGIFDNDARSLTNEFLRKQGFDGISYTGGSSLAARDAFGNLVPYTEYAIFPSAMGKIRNTLTGAPGGIAARALESPFFSPARTGGEAATDIALGTAGGIAGAATADEDATWQERAGRFAAGAALGAMGGPIARSPKGVGGLLREFARNEDGSLNLGAISRGRLDPPEGVDEAAWRSMSRNERRRANYQRRRGEYASRAGREVPDYGGPSERPVTPDEVPDVAQDEVYDRTYERLSDRDLPEDEVDETAYEVGRQARMEADDEVAEQAPTLWDDHPELRPPDAYEQQMTASDEVARLTQDVRFAMPYSKPAVERQERFIGAQTGLPGISGTEYRASTGRVAEELYDPETGRFQGFGETVGSSDPQAVTQAVISDMATRTGSTPVGSVAAETLRQFTGENLAVLLDPNEVTFLPGMRSGTRKAIGRGASELKNELPEVQDYADRMTALAQEELLVAHGGKSDQELQVAVENLSKYALDIARSVETRSGLTSDVLVAVLHRAVEATTTPAFLAYDRMRMALKNGIDPMSAEYARLEGDYKRIATVNAIYKAGLEAVSSAAGRALRANREDVFNAGLDERLRSFIPRVAGATVDSGDAARSTLMGNAPTAATAREEGLRAWNARIRAKGKGPIQSYGPSSGEDWDVDYWQEVRKREIASKPAGTAALTGSGRRIGGPLEREGLLWSDLFIRDDPSFPKGTPLTEEERMRWLFGLEEVGSGKDRELLDKFYDRMIEINPDDRDAVMKFWADAAREGGYNTTKVPAMVPNKKGQLVRGFERVTQTEVPWEVGHAEAGDLGFKRGPDWNQYKKTAETMTREEALKLTERTLKSRLEKATTELERATAQNDKGLIKRYTQAVSAAENELSGPQGLMARMERLYPPSYNRMPGEWETGHPAGYLDNPETLIQKAELLKELDAIDRGTQIFRAGLSVVTSNMLTSARMVEMSTMESAMMMANRIYTQAVWRSDPEGAKQLARGMWAGATPAWANFVRVLKTGSGPMESMNLLKDLATKGAPAARSDSMRGAVGWLAPMHRISRGIQEFFTTVAYYGELNRLAHVEADKAVTANRLSRTATSPDGTPVIRAQQPEFFPETYFANPTEEMRDEALETALTIASGGPHSWVSKQIAALKSSLERSDSPGGKAFGAVMNVLYPFVYGIDFTIRTSLKVGAGPVMYPVKAAAALAKGDRQAARAYGMAAAITSSIDLFLFHQITQGNITGKGPSDPAERQALLETTDENGDPAWRPDSMRVPLPNGRHIWMNYGSLPGIGVLAGVMSNMYDAYVWDGKQNETSAEVFGRLAIATMEGVAEGTFFRDTLDVASILTEPQSASTAASRFAGGLVGRAIPAAVRQMAQFSDPYRKAPEGFTQELMQSIPGLRGMVPNQVSPFTGEDVRMGYNPATLLAPGTIYSGDGQTNPLANEVSGLQRGGLRVGPTAYSATQQGRGATLMGQRQTGAAVRGAQADLADEANAAAMRLINSPEYARMTPQDKAANLEAVFSAASERAKYDVQGNLQLSPAQQLTRAEMAIPRYEGVSGTPEQIARRNQEISAAKSALSQYNQMYGPDMGELMLYRQDKKAWRDAVLYDEMDTDIRWLRRQQAARGLGLNPAALGQPGAPGQLPAPYAGSQFFSGTNTPNIFPQPEQSYANRLPPGLR